jgi:hypothetical protein
MPGIEHCDILVIDKVGNCHSLFALTIPCFVDRYAQAITCLPSIFQIRIMLDCANDRFAPDARSVGFKVPPEELPTIRSLFPLAKTQISFLIADSHSPSSGIVAPERSLCRRAGASNIRPALEVPVIDGDEADCSSPFGPTTSFIVQL